MSPTRADAMRNREQLLVAADGLFGERGIDASLEEIARRAGVGIGTLYRHFRTREALLEALLRDRFDALAAEGERLLGAPSPRDALAGWLAMFAARSATYRGLPTPVVAIMREEGSDLYASCHRLTGAGARLVAHAQRSGAVRADIEPLDVLALVGAIAWVGERSADDPDRPARLLAFVQDALAAVPGNGSLAR